MPGQTTTEAAMPSLADFRMSDFVGVVARRRKTIRFISILTIAVAFFVLMMLPTLYTTSATVMIDQRKNNVADQSSVLSALPTDAASLQNQIQILTSRDLARHVIEKLNLYHDPEFNGGYGALPGLLAWLGLIPPSAGSRYSAELSQAEKDAVIDRFLAKESIDSVGLSSTITVSFTARDPEQAARIANAIADAYIAYQIGIKNDVARDTTQWLNDKIKQLAGQVQDAEAASQKYKADNNLNESSDGTPLSDQQLSAIDTQIVTARTDLAQKEATYERLKSLVASGHAADVSQVVASPLIVQLRTQLSTLIQQESDMAVRYGPKNPKLIAVRQQRQDLESKIGQEVDRLAGTIENDLAVSRAQLKSLQESMQQAEKGAAVQNLARVKLKALQANATSTRTMYEAFVTRLRETQDAIQTTDTRVISRAPVPDAPSSPHRTLVLLASVPAGLLLGLLYALLAERFAVTSIRRVEPQPLNPMMARTVEAAPAQANPFRGLPVLADIPDAVPQKAANYVLDWPMSGYAYATAQLLRHTLSPVHASRPKVIAVTSAQPGEGKTTIAVSLARTAALAGMRVIVLDGNLQNPSTAKTMGLNGIAAGIGEVLSGTVQLSRALVRDTRSSALLLAAARPLADPSVVLNSPLLPQLLAHLKQACDLVILDAAPVLTGGDARALLHGADTVMMVVRDGPPRQAVTYAIDGLASMGISSAGIVLAH
ncbi:MAG: polysaccharide biosynthesis tyrosine autokinase [Proteobacteria bacterium]|nr:polysaccharide biosynthesis tyrosine autokinase [Pseudomonadota bacterium]